MGCQQCKGEVSLFVCLSGCLFVWLVGWFISIHRTPLSAGNGLPIMQTRGRYGCTTHGTSLIVLVSVCLLGVGVFVCWGVCLFVCFLLVFVCLCHISSSLFSSFFHSYLHDQYKMYR